MTALPVQSAAPAALPLTLDEVKAHCRVDSADDDAILTSLIHAATGHFDGWTGTLGRCLVTQDWSIEFDRWGVFTLPLDPVQSIVSITYFDTDKNLQTVDPGVYRVQARVAKTIVGCRPDKSWPIADTNAGPITVTWRAGYGHAADVPPPIRQAMLLLIGQWYENRESVVTGTIATEIPMAVAALVAPYRRAVV